ncbi:N-6 DNA methylase [Sterolibacterium denitrificans]|uniref:site-specific DNA-methyltransferase (adenine-specific) n=1 Tax=Sterolibacterium denitrificans TaxID=157592 RepID=A0A7Z7MVI1_9PROT|nr:N-6 DNA methylase [Sterolibacterium denitrificans]SMB27168.1 N-6 DNA methylase [Sterolibacterium denitrificans]
MPLTPEMRRSIDQIRDYLYGGGYPDPVANAEQLAFLFFFYLIEGIDAENRMRAKVLKQPYESLFAGEWKIKNPLNANFIPENHRYRPAAEGLLAGGESFSTIPREYFRWSVWARAMNGEALVRFVRDEVFAFFAELGESAAHNFMSGARLSIDEPTVLTQVISLVDGLRLDQADADTKGDLFEHILRQIKQAGELGQFRTPRHIIRTIVEIVDPKIGETIYDPAAGTAGFLVAAYNHIRLANSSPSAIVEAEIDGKKQKRGLGDQLSVAHISALQTATFFGNDVDPKMVRLATMNLTLRGLPNVRVLLRNVLTTTLDNERKAELGLPQEGYQVVLANPPFSGRVDKDRIVEEVKVGTSTATELLFLKYMLDSLRPGGRCGVVVPEGVLFGSTTAHKELRRQLIENNRVEAVLSLPGGVFQPYSGVKTSVLFFKKGGATENVLFLHIDNDGYKLDANHDTPIETDDLPAAVAAFHRRAELLPAWQAHFSPRPLAGEGTGVREEWPQQWWFADATTIRANDFNLSASRYRPMSQTAVEHRDPRVILDELAAIEAEIVEEVEALKAALGNSDAN